MTTENDPGRLPCPEAAGQYRHGERGHRRGQLRASRRRPAALAHPRPRQVARHRRRAALVRRLARLDQAERRHQHGDQFELDRPADARRKRRHRRADHRAGQAAPGFGVRGLYGSHPGPHDTLTGDRLSRLSRVRERHLAGQRRLPKQRAGGFIQRPGAVGYRRRDPAGHRSRRRLALRAPVRAANAHRVLHRVVAGQSGAALRRGLRRSGDFIVQGQCRDVQRPACRSAFQRRFRARAWRAIRPPRVCAAIRYSWPGPAPRSPALRSIRRRAASILWSTAWGRRWGRSWTAISIANAC